MPQLGRVESDHVEPLRLGVGETPGLVLGRWALVGDGRDLAVDLEGVTFLASSGLGVLIHTARRAARDGRRLFVVATNRAVLRPLEVTGSAQLFTVLPEPVTAFFLRNGSLQWVALAVLVVGLIGKTLVGRTLKQRRPQPTRS